MSMFDSTDHGSTAVLEPATRPDMAVTSAAATRGFAAAGYGYDYRADRRPRADRCSRETTVTRACALLGLFSAAMYEYFLTELPLGHVDQRLSFVSELSARDQPHHQLFEAMDTCSGLLIALLGLAMLRVLPRGRVLAAGCFSVIMFGLSTTAVGLFPMDCAPSASRICSLNQEFGRTSVTDQAHTVVSVIASTAVIASLVLLGLGLRQLPGWRPATRFAAVGLPIVCVLSAVLAILGLGWGFDEVGTVAAQMRAYLGVYERVELLFAALWIIMLSWCLLGAAQTAAGSTAGTATQMTARSTTRPTGRTTTRPTGRAAHATK